jgi:hypothetical protein
MRGVNVYLQIDGYGSKDLPKSMLDYLQAGGVKSLIFRPQICQRQQPGQERANIGTGYMISFDG